MADIFVRTAAAEDQATIRRIVHAAHLHPLSLDWPRFIVAEQAGEVIGVGQIKVLDDGTRELASMAVVPACQGSGVGSVLIWTLISRTPRPLYLRCATHNETFYQRFGFRTLEPEQMPASLLRVYRIVNLAAGLFNRITGGSERLLVMGLL